MSKSFFSRQEQALVRMLVYLRHELQQSDYADEADAISKVIESIKGKSTSQNHGESKGRQDLES